MKKTGKSKPQNMPATAFAKLQTTSNKILNLEPFKTCFFVPGE